MCCFCGSAEHCSLKIVRSSHCIDATSLCHSECKATATASAGNCSSRLWADLPFYADLIVRLPIPGPTSKRYFFYISFTRTQTENCPLGLRSVIQFSILPERRSYTQLPVWLRRHHTTPRLQLEGREPSEISMKRLPTAWMGSDRLVFSARGTGACLPLG